MIRKVEITLKSDTIIEGAGVKLQRVFGYPRRGFLDPFLLLDHFGSDNPVDYMAGFPWHPHRGIATVTYMRNGQLEHSDSLGNNGVIQKGGVQWMTAGSGIIHQEMPKEGDWSLNGFQFWINLPGSQKMTDPGYQNIPSEDIPEVVWKNIKIRVIAGKFGSTEGPVKDKITQSSFFDMSIPPNTEQTIRVKNSHTAFVYVYSGSGFFSAGKEKRIRAGTMAKLVDGDQVFIATENKEMRFIFLSGKPLNEPIEWRGPIVMNTKKELYQAFEEYHGGAFVKKKS
ncbi:MAG: pirin family protein [Bacteroidota bacterium]|nr:pirin family protein [Bacteroidota bacterium]